MIPTGRALATRTLLTGKETAARVVAIEVTYLEIDGAVTTERAYRYAHANGPLDFDHFLAAHYAITERIN